MSGFINQPANSQEQMLAFMPIFRANIGLFARTVATLAQMDTNLWQASVKAEVTALTAGTIIPDVTNLDGALPQTREQVLALMTGLEALLTTYNTPAQFTTYASIAGFTNTQAT
jgi:hypothetical protein